MQLTSYIQGRWHSGERDGQLLRDATTGEVVAVASSAGIDFGATLDYARQRGGPALRTLTFHERASLLKALAKSLSERKEEFYKLSYATGATKNDSAIDIEGGLGTLFAYASRGVRELPNSHVFIDGTVETLSKPGNFVGQHICTPLEGSAIHINAFNFPIWGMLEKLSQSLLAGMPTIVKPATTTAYLTQLVVQRIIDSAVLPEGTLQLVCGSLGDLFDHLTCQDVISFTGSATTAHKLRTHRQVISQSVRFLGETDSINSCVLGLDAAPGQPEFDLFVREVVREMTVKAGQKCTAIRKALVPEPYADAAIQAIRTALDKIVVGNPRLEQVRMGPLVSLAQRREVLARIQELAGEADLITGDPCAGDLQGADREHGAFIAPSLLVCRNPRTAERVHQIEAFGPVCTVAAYHANADAVAFARRGAGSLVASVFTADESHARDLVLGLAPFHGRLLVSNRHCAKESTGHGSPLPGLVHGGPGRAGGGEELGGLRGVMHYLQRTAVQSDPQTLTAITTRWIRGAAQEISDVHPFRKTFHELQIGDTVLTADREITLNDIERFAALSGDKFYAHMDEEAARRNPLFGGRVAHGYFLVSAAAGLFVDPAYGPVLANYGVDHLRFVKPVKPGDRIKVRLTCKEKSLRAEKGYGEVRWDTEITNQSDEIVATYDVLTMVSVDAVPAAGMN